ncbi:uncharacterized protein I206_100554 [Kwoniella pini CBS 10737]|uniref:G domain-containing protein n=1 Tax=Kwoniella pini CBS 10737 TaxID=1296096 RepID=A0A1B9ICU1_9TREE|nr:uncharacterized protein I206_00771 [Kwoniella pini CBS 10737]OCF53468.1 hypothetical protein I206_00771 [Kwoniella pini CBS 10737]
MSFIRPIFPYPAKIPSWFAGHMSRSLRELPTLLENIDLVIEARDSRLPLTSINSNFDKLLLSKKSNSNNNKKLKGKEREKLIVYTKRDLGEKIYENPLKKAFKNHLNQNVLFVDTRSDKDVKEVLKYAVRIAKENEEIIPDLRVLVIGMPNVGKSSLLNALRRVGLKKGKAFRTGAEAGITRKLTGTVKIYESPSVYVYDTPGVMVPYLGKGVEGAEKGLRLALTAGIKESLFEQDAMVDYLLWKMNKRLIDESNLNDNDPNKHQTYLSLLPLPFDFKPTDNLYTLLDVLSNRLGFLKKGGEKDFESTCNWLIKSFREGKLGEFTLDEFPKDQLKQKEPNSLTNYNQDQIISIPQEDENELITNHSISNSNDLDERVSKAVEQYLIQSSTITNKSDPTNSSISMNQQKKADKRAKLEERDNKLRLKGINVPIRTYGKRGLGKGSKTGEAGKFARSRR